MRRPSKKILLLTHSFDEDGNLDHIVCSDGSDEELVYLDRGSLKTIRSALLVVNSLLSNIFPEKDKPE